MRVRSQINLLVIILVVAFGVTTGGLIVSNGIATEVDDLKVEVSEALQNVYRLTDINKELMISDLPLGPVIERWNGAIGDLDRSVRTLVEHPASAHLSGDLANRLERTDSVWRLSVTRFEAARSSLDLLMANDELPDFRKTGLLYLKQYLVDQGASATLLFQVSELNRDLRSFDVAARDLVIANLQAVHESVDTQAEEIRSTAQILVSVVGAVAILGALLFSFFFGRGLAWRVRTIEGTMKRVAERDMSVRTGSAGNDEIAGLGRYLDETLELLSGFITSVQRSVTEAEELKDGLSSGSAESASAVNEITHNIESIRTEVERLVMSIEQSTTAVSDIDRRIKELNTDIAQQGSIIEASTVSAEEMDSSIKQVTQLSNDRKESAETLVQVILEGGEKINATNRIIDSVTGEVGDILEIIEIINAVAEQTNLLSMNAAIESAHAGEAGKGFAVVAEEIRKLAESTSDNAAQIDRLLKSITGKIGEAMHASRAGAETFELISRDVGLFREAMHEIVDNMETLGRGSAMIVDRTLQLSQITDSVTNSAATIAANTDQITEAMGNANGMSSSIADGIREINAGAHEILTAITDISRLSDDNRERMQSLSEVISEFHVEGTGVTEVE